MAEEKTRSWCPPAIRKILGKPALMPGEDPGLFDHLLDAVADEVAPQTLQESVLVSDIAQAEWDLLRLHGIKAGIVKATMPSTIKQQINVADGIKMRPNLIMELRALIMRAMAGDAEMLGALLARYGLDLDAARAATFVDVIVPQMNIDRMAAAAIARRSVAYAELERLAAKRPVPKLAPSPDAGVRAIAHVEEQAVTTAPESEDSQPVDDREANVCNP
jgi:hypothetical protein